MDLMSNPSRMNFGAMLPAPSWECTSCMSQNIQTDLKCSICGNFRTDEAERIAAMQREALERRKRERETAVRKKEEAEARGAEISRMKEEGDQTAAAIVIQGCYRGHLDRRRRAAIMLAAKLEKEARDSEVAAIKAEQIECFGRAAVQGQRVWRGYMGRRKHRQLKEELQAFRPTSGEDDAAQLMVRAPATPAHPRAPPPPNSHSPPERFPAWQSMIGYFEKRIASHAPSQSRKAADPRLRPQTAPARRRGEVAPGLVPGEWRPSQEAARDALQAELDGVDKPRPPIGAAATKSEEPTEPGDLADLEAAIAAAEAKMLYVNMQHESLGGPLTSLSTNFGCGATPAAAAAALFPIRPPFAPTHGLAGGLWPRSQPRGFVAPGGMGSQNPFGRPSSAPARRPHSAAGARAASRPGSAKSLRPVRAA